MRKLNKYVTGDFKKITLFSYSKILATVLLLSILSACGGGGGGSDSDSGELIGTGFTGKTAIGAAIANAEIRIKSLNGQIISTTSDAEGNFSAGELREKIEERGPYLLRVTQNNGAFLYSIAHQENATTVDSDSVSIQVNIHPYTDLIIRNWFAQQSLNIDSEFSSDSAISELPSVTEINNISDEFLAILQNTLEANSAPADTNLISTPFEVNGEGFDGFLDNSQVIINNNLINVIINQPVVNNPIFNTIITNVDLNTDFTDANDAAPSLPGEVRVLPTDIDSEALVVWTPSIDDKGVAFYNIYRDGILVSTTPFPVFIDMGLSAGINYEYTVEAIDGRGQSSGQSNAISIILDTPDTTAPPTATDVVLTDNTNNISLNWTQSEINDVVGFNIYRGTPGNVAIIPASLLTTITTTAHTDFDVMSGTTYCYRIVTFDAAGNESAPTAEECLTLGGVAPTPSSVSFSSGSYSVEESAGSILISVSRIGDLSEAINVDYSAIAGTATAGTDFTETSGTLNWGAADSSDRTFSVQVTENSEVESDETVELTLSNPSLTTSLGTNSSAVLTITDAPQVACVDLSPTTITTNTTLSEPCYNVNSNIAVRNAATLTINPGVRLQFAQDVNFEVEADGILSAIGTPQEPIIFTGIIPATGYWDGIEIRSVAVSQIEHAVIEYGGSASSFNQSNVGISFDGRLSVANSIIRHSGSYGVSLSGSGLLTNFSENTITLNENAPISIPANQVGRIEGNNSLAGNDTLIGGNRDYVEVQNASGTNGITSNQTWNLLDVDYRIFSGLSTNVNAELTLAPGVTLIFGADSYLNIQTDGTLKAIGTELSPITFTGLQQTPGFWSGIQFTFNSTDNVMDYTIVEYGGGDNANITANVGVFNSDGRLSLTNSTLQHSDSYGFEFAAGIDLVMDNVTSVNNEQPGRVIYNDLGLLDKNSNYSGNTDDRLIVGGGAIATQVDQTIKNIGIPYYFTSVNETTVESLVTIEPGVTLEFNSGGGLNIRSDGTLIADGTDVEPITFTGAQQTAGYWNGIQFTFSNNPNVINNAVVEYGGAVSGNTNALIGFFGGAGLPNQGTITNTMLRESATNGIEIYTGTTVTLNNNTFENIAADNILDRR
ncbi:MAG: Calx-beta domain-containing protein [Cellvibrionaceae bacterium]